MNSKFPIIQQSIPKTEIFSINVYTIHLARANETETDNIYKQFKQCRFRYRYFYHFFSPNLSLFSILLILNIFFYCVYLYVITTFSYIFSTKSRYGFIFSSYVILLCFPFSKLIFSEQLIVISG